MFSQLSPATEPVDLHWQLDTNEVFYYKFTWEAISEGGLNVDVFDLKDNPGKQADAIKQLKNMDLPPANREIKMLPYNGLIRAWTKYIAPDFKEPPKDDDEKLNREWLNQKAGINGLVVDITNKGRSTLYYLQDRDRTAATLLFYLPEQAVAIGDSWHIPMQMIYTDDVILVDSSDQFSEATLLDITFDPSGRRIAHLLYLYGARLEGMEVLSAENKRHQRLQVGCVGYGEFLIDQGRWKSLTFQMLNGTDSGNYRHQAFAIFPAK